MPYRFDRWKKDRTDSPCLYYWLFGRDGVKRNKTRLPVSEICDALRQLRNSGVLTREAFRQFVKPTAYLLRSFANCWGSSVRE